MRKKEEKYRVVKRKVKYPRLELRTGELVVVAPRDGDFDVPAFVAKHRDWINGKQFLIKKYSRQSVVLRQPALAKEELRTKIKDYWSQLKLSSTGAPSRVIIKKMKSKWGSCSSNKILSFNLLLCHLPDNMIKYIVTHECCHLKHRKHDHNFKLLLSKFYKRPARFEAKLFGYWFALSTAPA